MPSRAGTRADPILPIAEVLGRVGDSWRTALVLGGLSTFASSLLFFIAAIGLSEVLFGLGAGLRLLFLLVLFGILFIGGYFSLIRPLSATFSHRKCAEMLCRRAGLPGEQVLAAWLLEDRPCGSPDLIDWHVRDVAAHLSETDWLAAIDRAPVRRGLRLLGLSLLIALPVLVFFGPECLTAFRKMTRPFAFVPRAAKGIHIMSVSPGDAEVLAGEDVPVRVMARIQKAEPPSASLFYAIGKGGDEVRRVMASHTLDTGEIEYTYVLRSVTAGTRYRIEVGEAQSRIFTLEIVPRPEIIKVKVEVASPAYTGLPVRMKEGPAGDVEALVGSTVYVTAYSNQDLSSAEIAMEKTVGDPVKYPMELVGDNRSPRGRFEVTESTWYSVILTNTSGRTAAHPPRYRLTALQDAAPRVIFSAPGRDVVLPLGAELPVALTASDDIALKSVAIFFQRGAAGEPIEEKVFAGVEGKKEAALTASLVFDGKRFTGGDVVTCFAVAHDAVQKGESARFRVRLSDLKEVKEKSADWIEHIRKILQEVLEEEKGLREETERFSLAVPNAAQAARFLDDIEAGQLGIREKTQLLLASLPGDLSVLSGPRAFLDRIIRGEETRLVSLSNELKRRYDSLGRDGRSSSLASIKAEQDALIKKIETYLGVLGKAIEELKRDEREGGDLSPEARESLQDLKKALEKFVEDQKKVIAATADLAKYPIDDLTEEQKKELDKLAAAEDSLKKFLEEAYADFSRLPAQDFSDPALLKELNEIIDDVELAADALQRKNTEIAVPVEQAGLELAEKLTTHIEKWLPDTLDNAKWIMEEPLTTPETPMAELPTELEDLIGELTQTEEDMSEENEDVTSSWTDSLDKGAGWGTMDGPISNMSAQGVTGNRLPNTSEIGGRSGEGRTGRANGELVEDTATGKGGRNTPTRLSPDPYQEGQINDQSKDPAGGATGGGKVGGVGEEGLEGPPPPKGQDDTDIPLPGKSASIRNKAERIALELRVMNYPETEIDKIMANVRALESDVRNGRYQALSQKREVVLKGLKEAREWVMTVKGARVDTSAIGPGLRGEVLDTAGEDFPPELQPIVDAYRKALLSGGK